MQEIVFIFGWLPSFIFQAQELVLDARIKYAAAEFAPLKLTRT